MRSRDLLPRFVVVIAMLCAAALFLQARSRREQLPAHLDVSDFPRQIGDWTSRDATISSDVREVLGKGDFLSRVYIQSGQPYVDFFLGYFPSQRTGSSIHSPKNCLPGSGWTPMSAGYLTIPVAGGSTIRVNRYVIGKGLDRQFVLYWYQAHNRAVASEYWAKFYLVADAIRMNRTDGALVRIVTPITGDETMQQAQVRAVSFAQTIYPRLQDYVPR